MKQSVLILETIRDGKGERVGIRSRNKESEGLGGIQCV